MKVHPLHEHILFKNLLLLHEFSLGLNAPGKVCDSDLLSCDISYIIVRIGQSFLFLLPVAKDMVEMIIFLNTRVQSVTVLVNKISFLKVSRCHEKPSIIAQCTADRLQESTNICLPQLNLFLVKIA